MYIYRSISLTLLRVIEKCVISYTQFEIAYRNSKISLLDGAIFFSIFSPFFPLIPVRGKAEKMDFSMLFEMEERWKRGKACDISFGISLLPIMYNTKSRGHAFGFLRILYNIIHFFPKLHLRLIFL